MSCFIEKAGTEWAAPGCNSFSLSMACILTGNALMVTVTLQAVLSCLSIAINLHYVRVRILCTVTLAVLILTCTLEVHVVMAGAEIMSHSLQ